MRIMDTRVIVWFFIILLLSFFWRSNLGNGALESITPTLELPIADYNKGFAVFFIVFIIWTIPAILIQECAIKARYWISFNMLVLAGAQIGMGWVTNHSSVFAVRFFLGVGEAGVLSGFVLVMFHWYRTYETCFRVSAFFGLGVLIGSLSGILAFLLNLILNNQQGRYGWQWILTTVGLVTFAVAVISFYAIPEYPASAPELTVAERALVVERVADDRKDAEHQETVMQAVKGAFTDLKAWGFVAMATTCFIPVYCFYSYSPVIVPRLMEGRISVRIQLTVIVPPYICSCIANFAAGYFSDKLRMRGMFVVGGAALAILGHILLISNQVVGVNYFAIFLVCVGLYTMVPIIVVWGTENHRGVLRRAVVCGMIMSFSQIGGVLSRYIFDAASAPKYTKGYGVSLAMTALCGMIAYAMSAYHKRLNATSGKTYTI